MSNYGEFGFPPKIKNHIKKLKKKKKKGGNTPVKAIGDKLNKMFLSVEHCHWLMEVPLFLFVQNIMRHLLVSIGY